MFDTAFTLSLTQFARSLSFPERLQHRPIRNAALELWRLRNIGFDAMFYDVKALTAEETFYVSDAITAEGLIMIVPPTGQGMLTLCDNIDEYLLRGGRDVHAIAVAGIGGSAIGAAAFARNVADALGEPVAAVVSGYGLGDMVNEAIGGAFFFGWLGHIRNDFEVLDDVVGRPHLGAYDKRRADTAEPRRSSLDTDTVQTLLADPRLSFHTLVGHSKGNRVLSEALYALKEEDRARIRALAAGLRIVTFGGRIAMPPDFRDVIDVVGALDWYGEMNSRPQIETDVSAPLVGHSTNTGFPGSLQVTRLLKDIIAHSLPVPVENPGTLTTPIAEPVPETRQEQAPQEARPDSLAQAAPESRPPSQDPETAQVEGPPLVPAEPEKEARAGVRRKRPKGPTRK
ncbi:MAG: cell envelope biogenesis protein OmpA [Allorhizobium sp.]